MKAVTLIKNFQKLSDVKLLELAYNVLKKLNHPTAQEQSQFAIFIPNLRPSYSDMETAVEAFNNAVLAFANRGRHEKIVRDVRRAELSNALKLWAMQVEVFANGDIEILSESGFEISKQPTPIPHPGAPVGFKAVCTQKSELTLSVKKVKGAVAFVFELTEVGTGETMICSQGNAKCVQRNLKSNTYYDCCCSYIACDDFKIKSEVIRTFVQ